MQIFYHNKYACLSLCSTLWAYLSVHVELSAIAFASVCVHVVSLWKTQCYHGNTEQRIQKGRERQGRCSVSRPAPLGNSYTVTLFKDFYSLSVHMSLSLCFSFSELHLLISCQRPNNIFTYFIKTSKKAHSSNLLLNIYLKMQVSITVTAKELIISNLFANEMLMLTNLDSDKCIVIPVLIHTTPLDYDMRMTKRQLSFSSTVLFDRGYWGFKN